MIGHSEITIDPEQMNEIVQFWLENSLFRSWPSFGYTNPHKGTVQVTQVKKSRDTGRFTIIMKDPNKIDWDKAIKERVPPSEHPERTAEVTVKPEALEKRKKDLEEARKK